jgi:hypothetical protein
MNVYILTGGVHYEGETIIEVFNNPLQAEMRKLEEENNEYSFFDYIKIEPYIVTEGVKNGG